MKFDQFQERHLVAGIFLFVLLLIAIFFKDLVGGSEEPLPPEQPAEVELEDPCQAAVTASCEVRVEREFSECDNAQRLRDSMTALLANPQESDTCKASQLTMTQKCPAGCSVDFSSLYSLPGAVQHDVLSTSDSGCLVRGKRTVSLRANCVASVPLREEVPSPEKVQGEVTEGK
jgi:hypothetical protein